MNYDLNRGVRIHKFHVRGKHQVHGRSASATVMVTHVCGLSASTSRIGLLGQFALTSYNGCWGGQWHRAPAGSMRCQGQPDDCLVLWCMAVMYRSAVLLRFQFTTYSQPIQFCSRLVLQTILVALDPRMVCVRKKICGSGSADIRVHSPHTSGFNAKFNMAA